MTKVIKRGVDALGCVRLVDYKPQQGDMLVYKRRQRRIDAQPVPSSEYDELLVLIRPVDDQAANPWLWHCWNTIVGGRPRIEVLGPITWFPLSGTLRLVRP